MQGALVALCEERADRIALLDPPWETASGSPLGLAPIVDWRRRFETSYAALAFPWCMVPDPAGRGATRAVPPSGHVCGRMAADDLARGVPGTGANIPLDWVTDLSIGIDAAAHGRLNEAGVNAITVTQGRAPRLMGARLLSSTLTWRFVTTQRVICAIRRQLTAALQWAVFAPNDTVTRLMILRQAGDYFEMLRQRGALAGGTPEEAWFVRCDETTTTPSDREAGRLIVQIGVAPSAPLEFILLKLGKSVDQLELAGQGEALPALVSEASP
jgi:phage tail sheath protein FI